MRGILRDDALTHSSSTEFPDTATATGMAKGVITIIQDFIGPARRSYLPGDFTGSCGIPRFERREQGSRHSSCRGG